MKKLLILVLLIAGAVNAQSFNYQATVRDLSGNLITNKTIGVQIKIILDSATGTTIYTEAHGAITNDDGIIDLLIGSGITVDDFSVINWSTQNHWLEVSCDVTGGINYTLLGAVELKPVPFASYAITSGGFGVFERTNNVISNALGDTDTDNFVFGSRFLDYDASSSDSYARFLFHKGLGAFRVGFQDLVWWDSNSQYPFLGVNSIALGNDVEASGDNSVALSSISVAAGNHSIALGAIGAQANADYAIGMGWRGRAFARNAVAMGFDIESRAYGATVVGTENIPLSGNYATYVATDQLFVIGNGAVSSANSNALDILKNGNTAFSGNVGISTTTPETNYALNVNGDLNYSGTLTNISDRRYKENIKPLEGDLTNIFKVEGVQYTMKHQEFPEKTFTEGTQYGVIAQDLEFVLPNLIKTNSEGYKSVSYTGLIPVLIETLKTQQVKIDELKKVLKKVEDLEKQYNTIQYTISTKTKA